MMLSWLSLNRRNLATAQCTKGKESNRRRPTEEELRDSSERALHAYGEPLETVTSFKYMGRMMTSGDDDWPPVA